jgi:hypothetical protein
MFPNLRLMLSASLAIIVLVAIVGSSLVLFRPPPARMADMPEIVRPVMPITDDNRPALRVDAGTRRHDELQRLLALPSGPARAYAAEPPATFPYEVSPSAVPAAEVTAAPVTAPPAVVVPPAGDAVAVAVPATTSSTPAEPESIVAEAPAVAVVAALPAPMGETEPVGAGEPVAPLATGSIGRVDTAAEATAPVAGTETVPVSSIPAVEDAPIPRPKPQLALADPKSATEKPDDRPAKASTPDRVKAKAKPRRHATRSRLARRPLPPPTEFESQQGQLPFFDPGRAAGARQNPWNGASETADDRSNAGRSPRRDYAIRPPTGASR